MKSPVELDDTVTAPAKPLPDRTATLDAPARTAAPTTASGLAIGQQLGHFRIERALGAGGMGEVYLATDLALDRPVAVKVLPEGLAREPRLRERLVREARAQARVVHPNVGHIYFIGEEAGRLYFAMEYVPGETLAARVARGPLAPGDALAAIRAAVLGLREAQRHGFTHRDVKPSNLMFDAHGILKVLDFGLAVGGTGGTGGSGTGSSGTGTGTAAEAQQTSLGGTPLYMAPEQARGEAVDLRADIYALGVTLFHLVAGKPPFVADSVDELVSLHATAMRPAVPRRGQPRTEIEAIDRLCARMMAARPEDRFASYDELLRAIDLASSAHTRPAGFWVRSIASGLDFILASLVVTSALALIEVPIDNTSAILVVLALYQAFAVARWGRTAGKAIFELEVVDTATLARPRFTVALRRALALLGLPMLAVSAATTLDTLGLFRAGNIIEAISLALAGLGFVLLLYASLRVPGKRTVWDQFSRTIVRYRTTAPAGTL